MTVKANRVKSCSMEKAFMGTQTTARTINMTTPPAEGNITINDLSNLRLIVDFNTQGAEIKKVDNNLVIIFPDKGSIILTGYFAMEEDLRPRFLLPDGEELPDFGKLHGAVAITTAVGPETDAEKAEEEKKKKEEEAEEESSAQAQRIRSMESGVGEYYDDPGNLINGVLRLGWLPPVHWGIERDSDEIFQGLGWRDDDDDTSGHPEPRVLFTAGAYEDGYPQQNVVPHDQLDQMSGGRINIEFSPADGDNIVQVYLIGFTEGAILYLGDPNSPDSRILSPDASGGYTLTLQDLHQTGVFVIPPENDDMDMHIEYIVEFNDGSVEYGEFTVIVDAVADLPDSLALQPEDTAIDGTVLVDGSEAEAVFASGWETKNIVKDQDGENVSDASLTVSISVHVSAQFYDLEDGSESHMFYIQVPPGEGWTCWSNGVQLELAPTLPGSSVGQNYFLLPEELISFDVNGVGTADIELRYTDPDGSGYFGSDRAVTLEVLAVAQETPTDQELSLTNNTAFIETAREITIDAVSSIVTIRTGWASEDADGTKDGRQYDASKSAAEYAGATNNGTSANIMVSIAPPAGTDESATGETIASIVIRFAPSKGTLTDSQGNLLPGSDQGLVTLSGSSFISVDGQSLIAGSVRFTPNKNLDDQDLTDILTITVRVEADSGASAEFTATSGIVIDAVADRPDIADGLTASYEDDGSYAATYPGSNVTVEGSYTFTDLDGSELLYVLVCVPDAGFMVSNSSFPDPDYAFGRDQFLSAEDIRQYWREMGHMPAQGTSSALDDALNLPFIPGSSGELNDPQATQYLLLEFDPATNTGSVCYRDADGTVHRLPDISLTLDPATGELRYVITMTAPSAQQDAEVTIGTKGISLEKAEGDREYDFSNNIAIAEETSEITVEVKVLTGKLTASLVMHEDGLPYQYLPDRNGSDPSTDPSDPEQDPDFGAILSGMMQIVMSLETPAEGEYVNTIRIDALPSAAEGEIW